MTLPSYRHELTVSDNDITPRGPLDSGTAGDHDAAQLVFRFTDDNAAQYLYRIEVVNGAGGYDLTELLMVTDQTITVTVPNYWTAAGTATVRLIQCDASAHPPSAWRYYPPVLLRFAYRDEGDGTATAIPQLQELLMRTEQGLEVCKAEAVNAATSAQVAFEKAEDAAARAVAAETYADNAAEAAANAADISTAVQQSVSDVEKELDALNDRMNTMQTAIETVESVSWDAYAKAEDALAKIGDIETALDGILTIQASLIGGANV